MDLASAKQLHNPIANLLQPECLFHHGSVISRHGDHVLVAQEIGRVQHVDMQGMTLDPLATVKETTKQPDRRVDPDSQSPLDRVHCAHLVSDRTDATNPRRDVRSLGEVPTAEESLKEPGRLVNLQLHVGLRVRPPV